ncbi:phosphohydrolase [Poseidonibacter parvus]|uniref:Phosphohydrolase n=1 Tax=Poseidonibacter parvus TaxID=1850254 RepID=A0A1P8KN91_9BACT|nr:HD domain-containing phosphohydrolase [Poseidonibacter parvus]APW66040.1 phosphohydrolase [Poseidonibacter parvus]
MNFIKILGASGSKAKGIGTTSFQIFKDIIVDAGNVINSLGEEANHINHIFLTHSHADHITDLPFIIETYFEKRKTPLTIYALKETIDVLRNHSFNDLVWPDFTKINLVNTQTPSLVFKELKVNEVIEINDYKIKAIEAVHIPGACGFVVTKNHQAFIISGDTYKNPIIWNEINNNHEIKSLILECSFPDKLKEFAQRTSHLSPELIKEDLKNLKRDDISIFLYHLKPLYIKEIKRDINKHKILKYGGKILVEGDVIHIDNGTIEHNLISEDMFHEIMKINLALSSETNKDVLLEKILTLLRKLTSAEAGTLYLKSKDGSTLDFKVVQNDKLNINMGGAKNNLNWDSLPFIKEDGSLNNEMVAIVCAKEKRIINIKDVYKTTKYVFEGTKVFDKSTGYRSKSMLVIPLINHENEVIGVLQLINKVDNHEIIDFDKSDEKILKSLASQAAMSLTNTQLILSLEEFLNAFVSTIAKAIDAKSPYTTDHIAKVEKIALLLANAINDDKTIYKEVKYTQNDYKQIGLAAWMHDIGKISMPDHIIDKATKLEKIFDRIELIESRFEVIKRDKEIDYLKNKISKLEFEKEVNLLNEYMHFLKQTNKGGEFMDDKNIHKLNEIAKLTYLKDGKNTPLIDEDEYYNLSIKKGSLTKEEIDIIRNHALLSHEMISTLPFPKKYKDVLNIACNHHEKLNGKGYPRGLEASQIKLEDRIMIFADIFEALTASGRPYKDAMKLTQVYDILNKLGNNGEIDKNLTEFFFNHKILHEYANESLSSEQIDINK